MNTAMLERRANLLGPSYRLFYDEPVHLVRGEGVWLWDADGKRYLALCSVRAHAGQTKPRGQRHWRTTSSHCAWVPYRHQPR